MEANAKHFTDDPWEFEVERDMPEGDGPTDAELRADYLLEKLAEEQAALDHLHEFTARRMDMIRAHAETEGGKIERRMEYLQGKIRQCVPPDPKVFESTYGKKSIKLPHGTLGYRSSKETVEIQDKARALAFAKANGIEVSVTETVNKTPLHAYVKLTGDVPDADECGFSIVAPTDAFYVKAGG